MYAAPILTSMATVDGGAALGVDFGTSNTVAVVARPGRPTAPLLFDGSPLLPSAVYAVDDGLLAGRVALRSAAIDPARCEPHPKRCVDDGTVLLGEREFAVADLFAAVLARVGAEARRVLGGEPARVALTHPAAWGPQRVGILRTAAATAGLPAPELLPEPVAGAAYFLDHHAARLPEGRHALIYDLGGGTCDITLVRREGDRVRVIATDGSADAGGTYIDDAILAHLARVHPDGDAWARLRSPSGKADRRHRRMLMDDVRDAKESLSGTTTAELFVPLLNRDVHLTREELDALARARIRTTVALAAGLVAAHGDVAGIFLVGGASRMPLVATELLRATGIAPVVVEQPELVVAGGALLATALVTTVPVPPPPQQPPPPPQSPPPPEPTGSPAPIPPTSAGVRAVAIRPDGGLWALATPSAVRMWDPATGARPPRATVFDGDWGDLTGEAFAWSPDGRLLAVASPYGVEILEPEAVAVHPRLTEHAGGVSALAWSPDRRFLASATVTGELLVWPVRRAGVEDYPEWAPGLPTAPFDPDGIARLAWSPHGNPLLAALGNRGVLHLWRFGRTSTRKGVVDFTWHPGGRLIACMRDGQVRLCEPGGGADRELARLDGVWVAQLCCSPSRDRVAALLGDGDGTWIWSLDLRTNAGHRWPVRTRAESAALTWAPDGLHLVLTDGGAGRPVRVWNATTGVEAHARP